jgi:3-oxoacyl-[acyl-carrier-protein] synthase II
MAFMNDRRVVVTGIGLVTPLGFEIEEFWHRLLQGESGVDLITAFDASEFETKFAAEVKGFDASDYLDRREARRMDRFSQFAVVAAAKAMDDSGLELQKEDLERFGVIVSSGIGGMHVFERECQVLFEKGPRRISPFFIPMMIADIAPGHISIRYGLKGPNYCTTSACASSSHAVGDALRLIQRGEADLMVAGGAEATITRMGIAGFNSMKALSTRNDDPKAASRPFDADRDGFVMGEGAGIMILEELEHARARGAKIYGEIAGVASTADAYHITAPAPGGEGAARVMRLALEDAAVPPEEVQYINAHGTSTPHNDAAETAAIKQVFGEHAYELNVSSTKSMIGHLLGASGAVELVATLLAVYDDQIHPTINYRTPDPECDLDYTPNEPVRREVQHAISNSFGFGGHNVCLVVRKYPH